MFEKQNHGQPDILHSFFSVAEVNAVNSQADATKENTEPQLKHYGNLAVDMLENEIRVTQEQLSSPVNMRNKMR